MTKRHNLSWHWSISLLIYAVVSVLMTWPLVANLGTSLVGHDTDIYNVYWGNWWVNEALSSGQNPYMTHHLIYPQGFDLTTFAFSPLLAVSSFPLSWIFSPVVAYNLIVLLTTILTCVAMDALVRYLTGNAGAALVAGMTLGFAPCLAAQRVAHLNLSVVAWLPWAALTLTRIVREAKIRDSVLFAVTVGLATLTRLHVGALTLMFSGLYLAGLLLVERKLFSRRVVLLVLLAGLLCLLVLSPLLIRLQRALSQPGGENLLREGEGKDQTDLLAYVVPTPRHPIWGALTKPLYEQQIRRNIRYWAFLGFVPLALCCYALLSRPKQSLPWALVGLFFFLLALGPFLAVGGTVYNDIKLPYSLAPGWFSAIGFDAPRRFDLAMMPAFSVLVGLACAQISTRVRTPWLSAVFASVILFEYLVLPLPLVSLPPHSPFYDQMAQDTQQYAVVDLPLRRAEGEIHRYYQTIHHKPIVGGWDHRVPPSAFSFVNSNPLLSVWREDIPGIISLPTALTDLAQANVRYIILHKNQLRGFPEGMRSLFLTMRPVYEDSSIYVLSTSAQDPRNYSIAHSFPNGPDLIRPTVILDRQGAIPTLDVDTCWLPGTGQNEPDTCKIVLHGPDGTQIDIAQKTISSLKNEPACQEWSLELDLPIQAGPYRINIEPSTGGHSLDTWSLEVPIQVVSDSDKGDIPFLGSRFPVTFDAPIEMLGYHLEAGKDILWVDLYWRALIDHDRAYVLFAQLLNPVTQEQVIPTSDGILPTIQWTAGDIVHERRILPINDIPQGQYVLGIGLYPYGNPEERIAAFDADGRQWSGNQAILDIPILALPDTLQGTPVSREDRIVVYTSAGTRESRDAQQWVDAQFGEIARLQGYSLDAQQVVFGESLPVTLYWEANNDEPLSVDYTVFVHILNESGQVIAQHDGKPASGTRPIYTWRPGDIIPDTHEMVWLADSYEGRATIAVGLYDLTTQQRVPAYNADRTPLADNRVLLGPIEFLPAEPRSDSSRESTRTAYKGDHP